VGADEKDVLFLGGWRQQNGSGKRSSSGVRSPARALRLFSKLRKRLGAGVAVKWIAWWPESGPLVPVENWPLR
jgi:hypothetical protein